MYTCSCGKEYKRLKPFHNHRATCELLELSKQNTNENISHLTEMDVPSSLNMWLALQTALKKIDKLEKKIESQQRWIKRQKNKMSIIDWLNTNYSLSTQLVDWYNDFEITNKDLELVFQHDFVGGMSYIFQKKLPISKYDEFPIKAFEQKLNTLFVFNGESWEMLDQDEFSKMIDTIHKKLHSVFCVWNKEQQRRMDPTEIDETYYKNISKVMGGKYSREDTLKKIKFKLYSYLKFNLKNITEYHFTF